MLACQGVQREAAANYDSSVPCPCIEQGSRADCHCHCRTCLLGLWLSPLSDPCRGEVEPVLVSALLGCPWELGVPMGTENPEISCPSVGTGSPNVERYLGIGDWKARIPVARVQESPESGVGSCGGGKGMGVSGWQSKNFLSQLQFHSPSTMKSPGSRVSPLFCDAWGLLPLMMPTLLQLLRAAAPRSECQETQCPQYPKCWEWEHPSTENSGTRSTSHTRSPSFLNIAGTITPGTWCGEDQQSRCWEIMAGQHREGGRDNNNDAFWNARELANPHRCEIEQNGTN